ncbi:hypothetical protein AZA_90605 [Nitrospirillum viridazoti Y2]|nr:hypothetical protein AZA_90605 [Nitrospirillum amazonense Y2]
MRFTASLIAARTAACAVPRRASRSLTWTPNPSPTGAPSIWSVICRLGRCTTACAPFPSSWRGAAPTPATGAAIPSSATATAADLPRMWRMRSSSSATPTPRTSCGSPMTFSPSTRNGWNSSRPK